MNEITLLKSKARSWRERIRAQVQSGQSVREFCEKHQLNRHTFSYWKSKLKPGRISASGTPSAVSAANGRFIRISSIVQVAAKSPRIHLPSRAGLALNSFVGIRLPNGVQIDLGAGLESVVVHQLIRSLCGVGDEKS